MVTIHRERGFRFWINTDDHEPAHVHVRGDGECRINLLGPNGHPELMPNKGMTLTDIRHVLRIVASNQSAFIARWRSIHG